MAKCAKTMGEEKDFHTDLTSTVLRWTAFTEDAHISVFVCSFVSF